MPTTRSLEARYRRLLIWFPPEHRREHGDEMAGVLLAAAGPGRERPGRAESLNLMLSGLRVRLRPGGALADGDGWRDALAIFSVVMPIVMLAATCVTVLTVRAQAGWWGNPLGIVTQLIIDGQLLLVPLVLLRLRRWAVVAAVGPVALTGYLVFLGFVEGLAYDQVQASYVVYSSYLVVAAVLEIIALLVSAGPRRGLQLLSGRRWAHLALAVVPAVVIVGGPVLLLRYEAASSASVIGPLIAICAVAAIALGVAWMTSGLAKRLAVLFAAIACAYLAAAALNLPVGVRIRVLPDALALGSEFAVAVIAVLVVRRVRHRTRP